MRDLILTLIIIGSLPLVFVRPWMGILIFAWISYMNPHRLTWGFAYDVPFAMIVAVVTIVAYAMSTEQKRIPMTPVTVLILTYVVWTSITTAFALNPDEAMPQWIKFLKIQLMTVLTLAMMNSRKRIHMFVWVVAISLGFYGFKGGIFGLLSGGQYRFWGPEGSFIGDNNSIALALVMTVPLMYYLHQNTKEKWIKLGLLAAMVLSLAAVFMTYSRGGFLALAAMSLVLWFRARRRVMLGAIGASVLAGMLAFMPAQWTERMWTVKTYETDTSASQRFDAWQFSLNVARDNPITGGGFKVHESEKLYLKYHPTALRIAASAHSIYFEILGEHGWIGLILFLAIGAGALGTCRWLRKNTRGDAELRWAYDLGNMLQVSFIGYAVAGTFLNLATFDLFYHLVVVAVVTRLVAQQSLAERARQAVAPIAGGPIAGGSVSGGTAPAGLARPSYGGVSGYLINR